MALQMYIYVHCSHFTPPTRVFALNSHWWSPSAGRTCSAPLEWLIGILNAAHPKLSTPFAVNLSLLHLSEGQLHPSRCSGQNLQSFLTPLLPASSTGSACAFCRPSSVCLEPKVLCDHTGPGHCSLSSVLFQQPSNFSSFFAPHPSLLSSEHEESFFENIKSGLILPSFRALPLTSLSQ